MTLQPVRAPLRPRYPAHRRRSDGLSAWLRRVAAALGTSAALSLAACYGVSAFEGAPDDPDPLSLPDDHVGAVGLLEIPPVPTHPEDMAGGDRAPGFECYGSPVEWDVPAWLDGTLCGEEPSRAAFALDADARVVLEQVEGVGAATISVVDPDDEVLAELDGARPRLELDLPAGSYALVAVAVDPVGDGFAWIAVRVDLADEG